jgi:hypothetical protein
MNERITVVSFEDMRVFSETKSHMTNLKAGVPKELPPEFASVVKTNPGIKLVPATQPDEVIVMQQLKDNPELEVVLLPELEPVRPPGYPEKIELLTKMAHQLILGGVSPEHFTPTGRVRVASAKAMVDFDFTKKMLYKAQESAEAMVVQNDDSS